MSQSTSSISDIVGDPCWLADRYDPEHDAVHFRYVDRQQHRTATFLTDEYLGKSHNPPIIKRREALAACDARAPLHFIFHSAFCCSTLLARAVDIQGTSMGLKEPVILNDIVGWRMRGGNPNSISQALDNILTLLARPFSTNEAVIVKPSNLCNTLAEAIMALRPEAKALLVYAPLPVFLGSIARKGLSGRLWVRELMIKQLKQGFINLGLSDEDYLGLTDLQAAAVGWLAQHSLFMRMSQRLGRTRVATLDSERLFANPARLIDHLSNHFALGLDGEQVSRIVDGPAFTTHSKFNSAFDANARAAEQGDGANVHRDEIEKVSAWARILAENNGLMMTLPASLLA